MHDVMFYVLIEITTLRMRCRPLWQKWRCENSGKPTTIFLTVVYFYHVDGDIRLYINVDACEQNCTASRFMVP